MFLLKTYVKGKGKRSIAYSSLQHASPLWELTCHMGSQCHLPPGRGDNIPASTPANRAGTRFSDPGEMQGQWHIADFAPATLV